LGRKKIKKIIMRKGDKTYRKTVIRAGELLGGIIIAFGVIRVARGLYRRIRGYYE
jgi:hypothetical protein